jgi:hypothetical protein
MGTPSAPPPVLLFAGILAAPFVDEDALAVELCGTFGSLLERGPRFPFTDSAYYREEMGEGLVRSWIAFTPLRPEGCLPGLKATANALETRWARGGARSVNIDPGTLSDLRMVLASTKGNGHRLYLGEGVWGDLHYLTDGKGFSPLPWAYPDYRRGEVLSWFAHLRREWLRLVREGRGSGEGKEEDGKEGDGRAEDGKDGDGREGDGNDGDGKD